MLGTGESGNNKGVVHRPKPVIALGKSLQASERVDDWSDEEAVSNDRGSKALENDGGNIEDDEVEGKVEAKVDSQVVAVVDGEGIIFRGGWRCF